MSKLLSHLKIFENTLFKSEIKYYHVYDYYQHKCALFVTNDDKVYGINISSDVMTPSYECVFEQCKLDADIKMLPIEIEK